IRRRPDALQNVAVRLDGFREELDAGVPAGRAAAEQVRLQRREAVVAAVNRVGHDALDLPVALAGEGPVLFTTLPVLDVQVHDVVLGRLPALPRIVAAEDEVRRVIRGAEAGRG